MTIWTQYLKILDFGHFISIPSVTPVSLLISYGYFVIYIKKTNFSILNPALCTAIITGFQ